MNADSDIKELAVGVALGEGSFTVLHLDSSSSWRRENSGRREGEGGREKGEGQDEKEE